jgi:ABC-type Fe3+/spermidine/putrescine transport system ATPase subunit
MPAPSNSDGGEHGLVVSDLVRRYSNDVAVGPISFTVANGEFFSLLGPSGCGKTTTLRCIAGFESVDAGGIWLEGRRLDVVPAHKRGIGLVFQTPALFPHLTVAENVAFGLRTHRVDKATAAVRVAAMLELVGLPQYGNRMPNQLSGGQQQRIALARSLVLEPHLLLLDEPLSSLDLKLRVQMREELRNLQRRLRKTTIFVTHDQTEALALSDRIAVLSQGRIEQIGTPAEIYKAPISRFVADFIGNSNLIEAEVVGFAEGRVDLTTTSGLHLCAARTAAPTQKHVTLLIRPERIRIDAAGGRGGNSFKASIMDRIYLGEDAQYRILVEQSQPLLLIRKSGEEELTPAGTSTLNVGIEPSDIIVLER